MSLEGDEIRFLQEFGGEDRIVSMSEGIIGYDRVVVTRGPLKGNEGLIRKIDRHKRKVWLKVEMFGRKIETQVGLEIVEKR